MEYWLCWRESVHTARKRGLYRESPAGQRAAHSRGRALCKTYAKSLKACDNHPLLTDAKTKLPAQEAVEDAGAVGYGRVTGLPDSGLPRARGLLMSQYRRSACLACKCPRTELIIPRFTSSDHRFGRRRGGGLAGIRTSARRPSLTPPGADGRMTLKSLPNPNWRLYAEGIP